MGRRSRILRIVHVLSSGARESNSSLSFVRAVLSPDSPRWSQRAASNRVNEDRMKVRQYHTAAVAGTESRTPSFRAYETRVNRVTRPQYPRQESNLRCWFRRPVPCPLGYGGVLNVLPVDTTDDAGHAVKRDAVLLRQGVVRASRRRSGANRQHFTLGELRGSVLFAFRSFCCRLPRMTPLA